MGTREVALKNLAKSSNKGGRPKGSKDKISKSVKDTVIAVWDTLQADKNRSLKALAEKKPDWFYDTFGRALLPKNIDMTANFGEPLIEIVRKVLLEKKT